MNKQLGVIGENIKSRSLGEAVQAMDAVPWGRRICSLHGPWKRSYRDEHGVERFVPDCPACGRNLSRAAFMAGVPARFQNESLDSFKLLDPAMEDVVVKARRYAEQACAYSHNAILFGPTGTGKTHVGIGIAALVAEQGYTACYARVDQLIEAMIRRSRSAEGWREPPDDALTIPAEDCLKARILVLDEVCRFPTTAQQSAALFRAIDYRDSAALPTVVITNAGHSEAMEAALSPAGYDRIARNALKMDFNWPSFRTRQS